MLIRARAMRARQGKPGIWQCLDEAPITADQTGQPQRRVPARLARAEAHWLQDRLDAAQCEAELAADACIGLDGWQRGAVATWLHRTRSRARRGRPPRGPRHPHQPGRPARGPDHPPALVVHRRR